jgi:hypothetical protein
MLVARNHIGMKPRRVSNILKGLPSLSEGISEPPVPPDLHLELYSCFQSEI